MSSLSQTYGKADLNYTDHTDYRFILALFSMVLALLLASAIFTPVPAGAGITSEITTLGL